MTTKEKEQVVSDLKNAREEGRKQGMVQGICIAINYSLRGNSVEEIWQSAGLSIEECEANQVDEFDMKTIRKEFGEEEDCTDDDSYYDTIE